MTSLKLMMTRVALLAALFLPAACHDPKDSKGSDASAGKGGEETTSEPVAISGTNLTFSTAPDVDARTVNGYVVGFVGTVHVEPLLPGGKTAADRSRFLVRNVPAGNIDLIVMGDALAVEGAALAGGNRARRLNDIVIEEGKTRDLGEIDLPVIGQISGRAMLLGQSDHAGIHVYIPGTGFDATTDSAGNFRISPFVPAGFSNLFYEKDGYHRGRVEGVEVHEGKNTTVADVTLATSRGAKAFLLLAGGGGTAGSLTVPVIVGATPDAILMRLSEDVNFVGVDWQPLATSTSFTFAHDGLCRLYVQPADANGLSSASEFSEIFVDISGPVVNLSMAEAPVTFSRNVTLSLSVQDHSNPTQMWISESADFSGAQPLTYQPAYTWTLSEAIGAKTVFVKVADEWGHQSAAATAGVSLFRHVWSSPEVIAPTVWTNNVLPRLASNVSGKGFAVWFADDWEIHVRPFNLATGLAAPASIKSFTGSTGISPVSLGIDHLGNAALFGYDGNGGQIVGAVYSATGTLWSESLVALSGSVGADGFVEVLVTPSGSGGVVWSAYSSGTGVLRAVPIAVPLTNFAPAISEAPLCTGMITDSLEHPYAALDAAGRIWTTWVGVQDEDGSAAPPLSNLAAICANRFDPLAGAWRLPLGSEQIATLADPEYDLETPTAIGLPGGGMLLNWERTIDGSTRRLEFAGASAAVQWTAPTPQFEIGAASCTGRASAVDSHGVVTFVWTEGADATSCSLYARRLAAGTWGSRVLLATGVRSYPAPVVATGPYDDVVVAWSNTARHLETTSYFGADGWQQKVSLWPYPAWTTLAIASDAEGRALLIWDASDDYALRAAFYR